MRTVGELLAGKDVDYPRITGSNVTLRRAQRAAAAQPEAIPLFGDGDELAQPDGADGEA